MDPLQALLEQIRRERGLDLGSYKPSFVQRRLTVRLRARDCPDHAAYGQLLRREPEEYVALLDALTINLTRFFRDATTFRAIEEKILPELLALRATERRLRIWSAGCAGGEEPYSLAILLREQLGPALSRWRVDILGTDADGKALEKARVGRYDGHSFEGVTPRYRASVERYFAPGPPRQLAPEIQAMVLFQQRDLTCDPIPEDLDLILCRNVLIYFDRGLQEQLYQAFHLALREDGFLVLGKTEVLPLAWGRHFQAVDLREHIYRRTVLGKGGTS